MTEPAAKAQKQWVGGYQERVAHMSIVLPQLKGIKMLGLQSTITAFMQRSREAEIKRSLRIRYLRMISQANHSIQTLWTMTAGFVAGVFWTAWRDGLMLPRFTRTLHCLLCFKDRCAPSFSTRQCWAVASLTSVVFKTSSCRVSVRTHVSFAIASAPLLLI